MLKRLLFILALVFFLALAMQLSIGVATGEIQPTLGSIFAYGLYMAIIGALGIALIGLLPGLVLLLVLAMRRGGDRNGNSQ